MNRSRSIKPSQQDKGIQLGKRVHYRYTPICGSIVWVPLLLPNRRYSSGLPTLRHCPQAGEALKEGSKRRQEWRGQVTNALRGEGAQPGGRAPPITPLQDRPHLLGGNRRIKGSMRQLRWGGIHLRQVQERVKVGAEVTERGGRWWTRWLQPAPEPWVVPPKLRNKQVPMSS